MSFKGEDGGWKMADGARRSASPRPSDLPPAHSSILDPPSSILSARSILHPPSSILFLVLTLLCCVNGCAAVGAISYKLFGPPSVPAQYKPVQEPMLVLVENFDHPSAGARDAEMLQRILYDHFRDKKIAPMVSPDALYALQGRVGEEAFRKMSIAAIGRETGARQVLYVNLQQATVDAPIGGDFLKGQGAVSVRIVDAKSGQSRWPKDATQGYPISYETPLPPGRDRANADLVRRQLHTALAERIGRLFRKWKPDDLSGDTD
jgi:hypothetical protein